MTKRADPERALSIMLVAGEPSGDQLGAQLMAALKTLRPEDMALVGVGGAGMAAQGLHSLYSIDDTSVMGLREVVPRIPNILQRVRGAVTFACDTRPDLVVLIDSPDFTHRIARGIKKRDPRIRTVNYVAPQVWASRSYRARKMASYFDAVLTLFPFETKFFERHGLRAIFVGYPVVERRARMTGGDSFRRRFGIPPDAPLLAVLPGSRRNELRFILSVFRAAVAIVAPEVPKLVCVTPAVPNLVKTIRAAMADWPTPLHIVETDDDKFAAFDAADVALAASGTVTSELALSETPMVVCYKMGWVTYALMRPLIHTRYATLVNVVLDREAVPEFIQGRGRPDLIGQALIRLLTNSEARAAQIADLKMAVHAFGGDEEKPSMRAARAILSLAASG